MTPARSLIDGLVVFIVIIVLWEAAVAIFEPRAFVLPAPSAIASVLIAEPWFFVHHASITGLEMVLGLVAALILGILTASLMALFLPLRRVLLPLVVASQALPVFAIAPLLVIWLGFGIASKVAMATLILYFPITSALYDGLRRADPELLEVAKLYGASRFKILILVRFPCALPDLASGIRVAAALAPIGAVVGEWVGAAGGLGFVMLQANARMQTDHVFASLIVLGLLAVLLRWIADRAARWLAPWAEERSFA
ncbi:MAG: ABC transporter permease [Pseudomonadota bacterium]